MLDLSTLNSSLDPKVQRRAALGKVYRLLIDLAERTVKEAPCSNRPDQKQGSASIDSPLEIAELRMVSSRPKGTQIPNE